MNATTVPFKISGATLTRATLAALAAAAAILILFVLPAEYGIDPTGAGRALGLTPLAGEGDDGGDTAEAVPGAAPAPAPAVAVLEQNAQTIARATPWRTDTRTVTIASHAGIELKAEMKAGDSFVFHWRASGPVKMDMHGETRVGADSFTTFWKQKGIAAAQGSFTAPFAGIHGWYWRNQGEVPVTLTVRTAGFYTRLFAPEGE